MFCFSTSIFISAHCLSIDLARLPFDALPLSLSLWNVKRKRFTVMPTLCHPATATVFQYHFLSPSLPHFAPCHRLLVSLSLPYIVVKWRKYFSNANFRYAPRPRHEDIFDYCLAERQAESGNWGSRKQQQSFCTNRKKWVISIKSNITRDSITNFYKKNPCQSKNKTSNYV